MKTLAPILKPKTTLPRLIDEFGTEAACRAELEALRWPNGIQCPRCASDNIGRLPSRPVFYCRGCKYQFSVMAGTIFNDSHLKLSIWFYATFLLVEAKKGMSSRQLERTLGVSHKTAWYLTHRIRAAMQEADQAPLTGTIEIDETWLGGKGQRMGARDHRSMVLGALARDGRVRLKVDQRPDLPTLRKFIKETTDADETDQIMTDGYQGYRKAIPKGVKHGVVNHAKKEWVRAEVHTNGIEGVWSLLKRSLVGSYHQLSKKHLPSYLQEFEFRYNNRKNPYLFRDTLLKLVEAKAVPYEQLTA